MEDRRAMKSYKTTLMGIIAGVFMMIGGAMKDRTVDSNAPPVTLGNLAPAVAVAILGYLSKDHDISGGTRQ